MIRLSTREAAKKLGIDHSTLANYLVAGKVPAPETVKHGKRIIHIWTEAEIEHVRQLLPKIANGRKTRYKKQSAHSSQQLAKAKTKSKTRNKKKKA
jgi:predicted site-specific integrase-resolvase